jgi:raffinose/stachyose/melibiose transport system permease protein
MPPPCLPPFARSSSPIKAHLVFALILDGPIRCRNLLRAVFFIPNIMSILVVGYIWRFVYTSALPDLMTAIGQKTVAVLGKPQSVIYAIALVGI